MVAFRAIDPRGRAVAMQEFDGAEAAHAWFLDIATPEPGWRMEVVDDGQWAVFDDTSGFTAPTSRRPHHAGS
jgi:hypothetical protein